MSQERPKRSLGVGGQQSGQEGNHEGSHHCTLRPHRGKEHTPVKDW